MAKKTIFGVRIPKVLGFKLSKGTRSDLHKLSQHLETPEARGLAISALGVGLAYLAEYLARGDKRDPHRGRAADRHSGGTSGRIQP